MRVSCLSLDRVGISPAAVSLDQGFIAVDGTSLTVGEVGEDWFSVYLIPETIRMTVFGIKTKGSSGACRGANGHVPQGDGSLPCPFLPAVNIEVDAQTQAIVDTVERVFERYAAAGKLPSRADV